MFRFPLLTASTDFPWFLSFRAAACGPPCLLFCVTRGQHVIGTNGTVDSELKKRVVQSIGTKRSAKFHPYRSTEDRWPKGRCFLQTQSKRCRLFSRFRRVSDGPAAFPENEMGPFAGPISFDSTVRTLNPCCGSTDCGRRIRCRSSLRKGRISPPGSRPAGRLLLRACRGAAIRRTAQALCAGR